MRRRIADALYALVFPDESVRSWSWPVWRHLPGPFVGWIVRNYSPLP